MRLYIIGAYTDASRNCASLVLMPPYPSDEAAIETCRSLCRQAGITYSFSTRIPMSADVQATFEQLHEEIGADLRLACAAIFRAGLLGTYQEAIIRGIQSDTAVPMSFRNRLNQAAVLALGTTLYLCGNRTCRELQC